MNKTAWQLCQRDLWNALAADDNTDLIAAIVLDWMREKKLVSGMNSTRENGLRYTADAGT